jgi:hypothetical protein
VSGYDQAVQAAAEAFYDDLARLDGILEELPPGATVSLGMDSSIRAAVAAAVPVIRRQVLEEAADELGQIGDAAAFSTNTMNIWRLAIHRLRALAVSDEQEQQP